MNRLHQYHGHKRGDKAWGGQTPIRSLERSPAWSGDQGWRGFFPIHPALAAFPPVPEAEIRELASSIETLGLLVPIVTRHVAGPDGGQTYLIDGRARLDAMENVLGWKIVNEGQWHNALLNIPGAVLKVDHKPGRTDKQVADEVVALNASRRHRPKVDLARAIESVLRLRHDD